MVTDIGIIVVSLISMLGFILMMFLSQWNYKNKKTFLHNLSNQKKVDGLKLKKLKREMDLDQSPPAPTNDNVDLNKIISNIAGKYNNKNDDDFEDDESNDWTDTIAEVVKDNPEIVQRFIGNFAGQKKQEIQDKILGD